MVCALPAFLMGWRGGMLRGVSPLYRAVIPLVGVRQRAGRRPALPRLGGEVGAGVPGVLLGGGVLVHPRLSGRLDLGDGSGQLRVLEPPQVCEGERVAVDAVVPGPAGGGGQALEGVVGVGGAGGPAAAAAVGHGVQRGVVRGQLLRGGGRGEGGAAWDVASRQRRRVTADQQEKLTISATRGDARYSEVEKVKRGRLLMHEVVKPARISRFRVQYGRLKTNLFVRLHT